jgi:hypothetical protein
MWVRMSAGGRGKGAINRILGDEQIIENELPRRKRRGIKPVGAVRSPWKMMYSAYDESTTGF